MTAQFRTLSDIEGDIDYRFSIAGLTNRHSPARKRQLFNVSWQKAREQVALHSEGDGSFLYPTATAALPTTPAATGEVYAEVDWTVNAIGVYGVRVLLPGATKWRNLKKVPFSAYQDFQQNDYFEGFSRAQGPIGYTSRLLPDGDEASPDSEVAGKVMIFPVPTSGSYRLWYLKAWLPRTGDDNVFPGHPTMTEYAIWDTMIKMLGPDADSRSVYQDWKSERKECLELLIARAATQTSAEPLEPRDARHDGESDFDFPGW